MVLHPQQLVILFRIGRPLFLDGGLHIGFGVLLWLKIVEIQKQIRWKQPPANSFRALHLGTAVFHHSSLIPHHDLITISSLHHSSQKTTACWNWETLTVRCARASAAAGSSRIQPEMTHEVISWSQSCPPTSPKNREFAPTSTIRLYVCELVCTAMATACTKKRLSRKVRWGFRGCFETLVYAYVPGRSADGEKSLPL